jgi:hypothetical protein
MIAWWQHLSCSSAFAILLGTLAGFCLGGCLPRRRIRRPEYPICTPRISRAWLRACQNNSRRDT